MFKPIRPESVHVGDRVQVLWRTHDATHTVEGTVARIVHGGNHTVATTAEDVQLFAYLAGTKRKDGQAIYLLKESPARYSMPQPLF